ncbi:glycogen synthase [Thermocrinis sp.]
MRIVIVASESAPYLKAGGLGDVIHSLSKALIKLGHTVYVIMPKYAKLKREVLRKAKEGVDLFFDHSWIKFDIYEDILDHVRYFFLDYKPYYGREYPYAPPKGDYHDNALRFGFLSLASLQAIRELNLSPDIIHIHDWHTGLLPLYKSLYYHDLGKVPVVFTVHNGMHQGIFDAQFLPALNLPWDIFHPYSGIEFYGKINFMKSGAVFCDVLTTVSPSYAEELKQSCYGLEGVFREKKYFFGILNGIDYDVWNPEKDHLIPFNYRYKNFKKGKLKNKAHLKYIFGIKTENYRPLIGIVARLTAQKGFDLLALAIEEIIKEEFDVIILGSGEDKYQEMLVELKKKYPTLKVRIEYSEELAHKIYAGSDIFLMPSLFEPCGISQMIAMRYGTVPVVRHTGGLKDTVKDVVENPETGTGFTFDNFDTKDMMNALLRARVFYDLEFCNSRKVWSEVVKRCMKQDFSWERSAKDYESAYSTAKMLRFYDS